MGLDIDNATLLLKAIESFIAHPQSSGIECEVTQVIDSLNCSPAGQHFGITNCSVTDKQYTIRRLTLNVSISFKRMNIIKKLRSTQQKRQTAC